ncbi:hypothetical protein [Tuwongella immobilis]|uniref:LarA-like N-terminal domain-containing protein n=1 Tax=Tuwongella immobilis TaxID=692036 RepID=A0A6C2YHV1_9BACT|nr:hypothetical protein [Tuwongella immobilis]VIP00635.1 Uncharacterized protein OS=Singulisphaera acidiphila (strain ATCC BAA-1392 / DSM 18658 / VKM B-2454 / MOB10) GN=Sinac_0817 PE=4 SV=1 [Tuwongella immobilis]VTR96688.1 Uncharacterized protein OS=Singulisphaera acidiphila (strain ATCC BAA-1392 / DSM 18658 / VKM B-2454 / MOB10) GN=Sinac_0817 PE=4 SV=1 [Tuwongella immobilis]
MDLPLIARIRQTPTIPALPHLTAQTLRCWRESPTWQRIQPGQRIAVGVGSRGIANLFLLTQATIQAIRERGAEPFLIGAMGSHGGATAEGQREVLASYGLTEERLGVPIVTEMDVDVVGQNAWGEPCYFDRNAMRADGLVLIARVKPHTDFHGQFESGLIKMLVIGLGKRDGASQHHRFGVRGLRDMIPETGKVLIERTPFLGGLAVLENAQEETAHLEVLDRETVWQREPELLEHSRNIMGRLPFEQIDTLIVGEVGKNYSGSGMDPNVIGRYLIETAADMEPASPKITRIVALELSPESHGNGVGIGLADLTTDRFLASIDSAITRMNVLTARCLWRSKLPFGYPTDREAIEVALDTCWQPDLAKVKLAIVPSTLEVAEMAITAPLLELARQMPGIEILDELRPMPFDTHGNLMQEQLFPNCVRARRSAGHH